MFCVRSLHLQLCRFYCSRTLPTLTLFTKDQCSLCDIAKDQLEPFRHRVSVQPVDISRPENRLWNELYRWDIPVFHLNGRLIMKHRVDVVLLDKLLRDIEKLNQQQ